MAWQFGMARTDITPASPQWMDGFGWRSEKSQGVYHPIAATALYLTDGKEQALILNAEVLDFGEESVKRLRRRLQTKTGVPGRNIVYGSTHNHDGPKVSQALMLLGEIDPDYLARFEDQLVAAAVDAKANARKGGVQFQRVRSSQGVNRRVFNRAIGAAGFAPNPEGAHDRAADTRWFHDGEGQLMASMTAYGCHATACRQNRIGGDYPGFFREALEKRAKAPAVFSPGCGGNINPWFPGEAPPFGDSIAAGKKMGEALAREVLGGRREAFNVPLETLRVTRKTLKLPLQDAWPYQQFRDEGFGAFAETLGEKRVRGLWRKVRNMREAPFELQVISLNPQHHLVFWSAEICTDLGIDLKDRCPGQVVTPHGYANGSIGYLCPAHMYPQGGYEPVRSCPIYKLPAPFKPDTAERVIKATLQVIRKHAAPA